MEREGVPWGLSPRIQIEPLRSLTLHCVVARFGLRLRGCPIPPLEVAESLLDVAARKLGNDVLADACGSIPPIFAKSGSNLAVQPTSPSLTQAAGTAEHRSMGN